MERTRRRYAVVGTGARAEMFVRALVSDHADDAELVALADPNPARIRAHNRWLEELGHPPVAGYPLPAAPPAPALTGGGPTGGGPTGAGPTGAGPTGAGLSGADPTGADPHGTGAGVGGGDEFAAMLDKEGVDVVIVTSVDATHDGYIVAALAQGRDVITEKPMTVDAPRCTRILRAARAARERGAGSVAVTFNYRYNPVHEKVREVLASGAVGEVGSVHFEWLLDVRHGADYFRRWHRDKANSGGLLVHKASHHFDLVNWWLGATPVRVYADTRLFFYGPSGAGARGYDRGYRRAFGDPAARDDPFALDLAASPRLRELYLDAEREDGYLRDRSVFDAGVSIEDDMSVLVRYDSGATMTYHLTAYAPWEGYRVMVNGSRGRLELEVVESEFVDPTLARGVKGGPGVRESAALHGVNEAPEGGHTRLTLHPYWAPSRQIELPPRVRGGHGGADSRMTADIFGGRAGTPDPLGRSATERDGALALLTGLAANASAARGTPVDVADLIDPDLLRASATTPEEHR